MSEIKVNNITNYDGSSGPVLSGITTVSSTGYMTLPKGPTEYRGGRGRGIFAGGGTPNSNRIEYITISTTGNSKDFGDLSTTNRSFGSFASSTRGLFFGGEPSNNRIEYITISATGSAFDFGDLLSSSQYTSGSSNQTRGLINSSYVSAANSDRIEYVTISNLGNSTEFGRLTQARRGMATCASPTRSISVGGLTAADTNVMDYVTIATTGNAQDFGDLINAPWDAGGCSNSTRGLFGGGQIYPSPYPAVDVIQYITIASLGDTIDFGDLTVARSQVAACASSSRGVWMGGDPGPSLSDRIDYVNIDTLGNAETFGNLIQAFSWGAGCSDSHGGIG